MSCKIFCANAKGQGATELIATYGWALVIILLFTAAIYYAGFFNVTNYATNQCSFKSGFECDSYAWMVNDTHSTIVIISHNGLGYDIGFDQNNATIVTENLASTGKHNYTGTCSPSIAQPGDKLACIFTVSHSTLYPTVNDFRSFEFLVNYKNCQADPDYINTANCSNGTERYFTGSMDTKAENYWNVIGWLCGNGVCDDNFGETEVTCVADCP